MSVRVYREQSFKMYNAVVIDTGSYRVKAGFSHEHEPHQHIPSLVALPRPTSVHTLHVNTTTYVGHAALRHRGCLRLRYPIEHGLVKDWSDLELIWKDVYRNGLQVQSSDHPVLLTETPLNPRRCRETMIQIVMEKLDAPAVHLENVGRLAVLASDVFTGVAVDCGDGVATVVPVYEGMTLRAGIQRNEALVDTVHQHIQHLLQMKNNVFREWDHKLILRDIKKKCLYVPLHDRPSALVDKTDREYQLPDGRSISLTAAEVIECTSDLFHQSLGLCAMIHRCIANCDAKLRGMLRANIVVCGGTSMLPGLVDRMEKELSAADRGYRVHRVPNPENLPWIGGAMLCRIMKHPGSWINKHLYSEYGSGIVHRYCF